MPGGAFCKSGSREGGWTYYRGDKPVAPPKVGHKALPAVEPKAPKRVAASPLAPPCKRTATVSPKATAPAPPAPLKAPAPAKRKPSPKRKPSTRRARAKEQARRRPSQKTVVLADPARLLTPYRSTPGFKAATWLLCETMLSAMRDGFLGRGKLWRQLGDHPVRQVAAKLLGIATGTVQSHLAVVKKAIDKTEEGQRVAIPPAKLGRPKKTRDTYRDEWGDFYQQIIGHIDNAQRNGTTLSVHKLNRLLREENSDDDDEGFTYDQMIYYLKKLGFRWGRISRSIKSGRSKPYVLDWLKSYCTRRHALNQQGAAGDHTDVDAFLDESALWRDEGGNWSWYHNDRVWSKVNTPKEKWMIVQVIFAWWEAGERRAAVFDDCLLIWQVWDGKKRSKRVQMTGKIFEKWVETVCEFAKKKFKRKLLRWHMDNASYHKAAAKDQHKLPNFDEMNQASDLANWLVQNTLPTDPFGDFDSFFEDHNGDPIIPDVDLLRQLCKAHAAAHPKRVSQILGTYKYVLELTAPYWPQAQPTELSWSNMKWCWRNDYDEDDRDDPERFVRTFFESDDLENHLKGWVVKTDKWCTAVIQRDTSILTRLELQVLG